MCRRAKKREEAMHWEKNPLLLKKCVIKKEIRRNHVFNDRQILFNHGTHATFVKPHRLWKGGKGKKCTFNGSDNKWFIAKRYSLYIRNRSFLWRLTKNKFKEKKKRARSHASNLISVPPYSVPSCLSKRRQGINEQTVFANDSLHHICLELCIISVKKNRVNDLSREMILPIFLASF